MPNFSYTARSSTGALIKGKKETKDIEELTIFLREKGYILTFAEGEELSLARRLQKLLDYFQRIKTAEKIIFTRNLTVMLGAGLSLNRSLRILARQTKNPKFSKIIKTLEEDVRKGKSFAESLSQYPKVFDNLFVNMVRVGEIGGSLEKVLRLIAIQLKKDYDLAVGIKSALAYPAVIVVAMFGIGGLMMIVVVPKLTSIFEELNVPLPLTTRLIIQISKALGQYAFLVLTGLGISTYLIKLFSKTKKGKQIFHWFFLRIPILGELIKKVNSARFARNFGSLLESGVAVVKALKISARTLGNVYYRDTLLAASKEVQKGIRLGEFLTNYPNLYPILVTQMINVGEETGSLNEILERLANFFEEEISTATKNLTSIIEPILMIIIGAAVGFFAISMLTPMYSMMGTI